VLREVILSLAIFNSVSALLVTAWAAAGMGPTVEFTRWLRVGRPNLDPTFASAGAGPHACVSAHYAGSSSPMIT
jgi:hypothetical protein